MGIGGISMSGLARHYQLEGFRVTGCDATSSTTTRALIESGIPVAVGHDPAHLEGVDTLISTMAAPNERVSGSVEEIRAALELGISSIKRVDLLGRLFRERTAIGVSGSHGKSTITGMIAGIFLELADDPSVQIGANLPDIGGNMRHGRGKWLVAEVDESDPGFARLESGIAVLPNLEDDHVANHFEERRNYHASLADLEAAMRSFAGKASRLIWCRDSALLGELFGDSTEALTYGFASGADFRITDVQLTPGGSTYTLSVRDGGSIRVALQVPGLHNAQNSAAALAAAHTAGLDLQQAAEVLGGFKGVGRRWQSWGTANGALVIDDYAVHPAEVKATLAVARNTGRRVLAVLQPHRWVRTALHWEALADAATAADEVLVLDVYAAGEQPVPGVTPADIVNRIRAAGRVAGHFTAENAIEHLQRAVGENDLVVTLGAGDVWRVAAGLTGRSAEKD
mgnify:CR=1 FL=1